jgi:hypothetical protein
MNNMYSAVDPKDYGPESDPDPEPKKYFVSCCYNIFCKVLFSQIFYGAKS